MVRFAPKYYLTPGNFSFYDGVQWDLKVHSLNPGLTLNEYESDIRSNERYFSSCQDKARKNKIEDVTGWPLRYRCNALPTEQTTGLVTLVTLITVRAFDILTRSLSTTKFVFVFNLDNKLRRLSSVCRWRKLFGCRIHESRRPTSLFGLCTELIGIVLPFVVIQADWERGVSSKEVVS